MSTNLYGPNILCVAHISQVFQVSEDSEDLDKDIDDGSSYIWPLPLPHLDLNDGKILTTMEW